MENSVGVSSVYKKKSQITNEYKIFQHTHVCVCVFIPWNTKLNSEKSAHVKHFSANIFHGNSSPLRVLMMVQNERLV